MDLLIFAPMEARNEILTASPHFLGLASNLTGSDKCKMAASEPEVIISPFADIIAV